MFNFEMYLFSQRLLPMLEGGSDLFTQGAPQVPTSSVYTIRPFTAADKVYHRNIQLPHQVYETNYYISLNIIGQSCITACNE